MLFSPGTVVASDMAPNEPAPATPAETQVQPAPATPAPDTKTQVPAPVDAAALLAAINQDRDRREAGVRAEHEAATYKTRAEAAEAKLAAQDKAKQNRMLDPAGFLRKMGYTDKELALTAEGIMFTLVPDKAPGDHRAKLVEAQMLRDREAAEEDKKAAAAEASQTQVRDMEQRYNAFLLNGVENLKPGAFPASQAWFDKDHKGYARELLAVAQGIAEEANKAGVKVDLSAAALAPVLEKQYADRAKRWASFSGTKAPEPTQLAAVDKTQVQATETPAKQAESTPPAGKRKLTDKELIDRATAAAFGL